MKNGIYLTRRETSVQQAKHSRTSFMRCGTQCNNGSCNVSRRWDLIQGGAGARDFFKNVFSFLCPDEGRGVGAVMVNVVADRLFKLFDAAEHSVTDAVACNISEPAFDHVQPTLCVLAAAH